MRDPDQRLYRITFTYTRGLWREPWMMGPEEVARSQALQDIRAGRVHMNDFDRVTVEDITEEETA